MWHMTRCPDELTDPTVNVLLVGDRPDNLRALHAILREPGRDLVKAPSGGQALDHLLGRDFAVVMLDVGVRGREGFETARLIRGRGESRPTPIVFLADEDCADFPAVEAYKLGAVDYLIRPLLPEIVRAKVTGFVDLFLKTERVKRQAEQLRHLERQELERRLAEAALRQSEEHFRVMADSAPVLLWMSGPDARRHFFNKPWLEFTGRTLEQERGDGWTEGLHPDDRPRYLDTYQAAFRDCQPFRMEYRLRRADGAYRWVLSTGTPRFGPDGGFAGYVGSTIDITERRRAEEALRESEARFRQLADAMPQIVWSARPDGFLDYYNARWYEFTGFPEGQGGDDSWKPILHPDDVQKCLDTWYGAVRSGEGYQIQYRFKDRRTGGYRWYLGRALPVRDEAGRVVRWFGTCTDIDDQKRAEEALQEADRRKDEFLRMLAHELRNPLAPLQTSLQLLRHPGADPGIQERALDAMGRQVAHLARLVGDLVDVSRIVQGVVQLRAEQLDLARLVATTAEDRRPVLAQAGLALEVDVPPTSVWVWGDATRLAQVLNNLLDNAARFTDRGGRVGVRLTTDGDCRQAVLTVTDTGVGIAPEVLGRLFDVFAQADNSLDRSRGGLGLGLSVVKGMVALHGGEVGATSAGPGQGAEFTLRLPVRPEPGRPPGESAASAAGSASATGCTSAPGWPPARERLRVLIVEDSRDAADTLGRLLELLGYAVAVARTGPEGVATAEEWRPDVVLCDIGLPGLDGYAVARELRRNPATAGARLFAVTGYGSEEDRRRSQEAGFNAHLVKPVEPAELLRALARPFGVSSQ
jgi:PAS domain S-box-containing protein